MADNAPKVLLRSEQTGGHIALVELTGGGRPVRTLLVMTPAGFERYFDRISARITGREPPPEAFGPIPEVVTVGPPLGGDRE
ncbi:MAG: hypothetical protein U0S48_22590 [Solirubrobacteraceae bacterium]